MSPESPQSVSSLAAHDSATVLFRSWTPLSRGSNAVRCTTALVGDMIAGNNALSGTCDVRIRDAGVSAILAPAGRVDSGTVVTPRATVRNYGTTTDTFPVVMRIGAFYVDTQRTAGGGGKRFQNLVTLSFRSCTLKTVGTYSVKCSTMLAGDMVPANNSQTGSVIVRSLPGDVGVVRIISPSGVLDSGAIVAPKAVVMNYGIRTASFPVWFAFTPRHGKTQEGCRKDAGKMQEMPIAGKRSDPASAAIQQAQRSSKPASGDPAFSSYAFSDSIWVTLTPRESLPCSFHPWTGLLPDTYDLTFATAMPTDTNPTNDSASGSFVIRRILHDVGVLAILAPKGNITAGDTVAPKAVIKDFGTGTEIFMTKFLIGTTWRDSITDTLQPGAVDTITFRKWVATPAGHYFDRCSTAILGDVNPANDMVRDSFWVVSTGVEERNHPIAIPRSLILAGGEPNPFNAHTVISYGLPKGEQFQLVVYNSAGDLVQVLASGHAESGYYTASWRGCDESGRKVARGIYFVRLQTGDAVVTRKLVKLQ